MHANSHAGLVARPAVVLLLCLGWAGAASADGLTTEERARLRQNMLNVNDQAVRQYQDGKYAAATVLMEKALEMTRQLYPPDQYPDGHPELATTINNLGLVLHVRGQLDKAEALYREALAMRRKLYPPEKHPDGHPDVAQSLGNLSGLLYARKDYAAAEPLLREAVKTYRRLYPDGDPGLALCLDNLGVLLRVKGDLDGAEACAREAVGMYRKVFPALFYPDGQPDLAVSLNNLGFLLIDRRRGDQAEPVLRESLAMRRKLYPADRFPDGRPELAASLHALGALLENRGEFGKAGPLMREALEMRRKQYPADQFPDGAPELAQSIDRMGGWLQDRGDYDGAEPYYREALAMLRKLYPKDKHPEGAPDLAAELNNVGTVLLDRGEFGKAEPLLREALEMRKRLYPPDRFPDGYADLADSLSNMGVLLQDRGDYDKAEPYYRQALEMRRKLYPKDKYPHGHPDLAQSLINLGVLQTRRETYGEAERYYGEAVEIYKSLYPPDKYPNGVPEMGAAFNNLARLLEEERKYDKAEAAYHDALDVYEKLYPGDAYPNGHPVLATTLSNLGVLELGSADLSKAGTHLRQALDMYRKLYPPGPYPDGHPDLARGLFNLGGVLYLLDGHGKAAPLCAEAAAMYDRLIAAFAEDGAEAEAVNLAGILPGTRNFFLAASAENQGADPAKDYAVVWPGKTAIARAVERRRRLLHAPAADPRTRAELDDLAATRQDLARLILAPALPGDAEREKQLRDLSDRKERLEKDLAAVLPPSTREPQPPVELADRLPDGAAFVDLYRYLAVNTKTADIDQKHYAAFVLRRGRPVRRIKLDDGAGIDRDLAQWRQDIEKGLAGDAAGRLHKNVWAPIAAALGEGVDTVYVCPDGDLAQMPWPALPGDRDGHDLVEDYTFAVVPSGLFLLDQLSRPAAADRDAGVLLALGGVRYDREGGPADQAGKPWKELPGTRRELAAVAAQARRRAKAPELIDRTGADADVAHLLRDLPRARWAHLATHGFFAAKDTQERGRLFRPRDFAFGVGMERLGAAVRNPLTESGLVLAGANQPTDADTGLLTGEAIAGLDLDGMDLAVLSACRTGLGEDGLDEGAYGLQCAFHVAGAKNVVASLWVVDDDATAALMNLFYYHLWEKNEPPLEALHHAQLELYRSPQGIAGLAKGRGAADWDETVKVVTKPAADPKASPTRPAAVKDWAAFVLSGAGR